MDFSVLIPVLNEAQYLGECLMALESQSIDRDRFEIIVIDNGSTDRTLEILQSWPNVTLLHEPERDVYLARNRGIEAARGKVIAFTDADCAAAPDWLEQLDAHFGEGEADIVVGRLAYPTNSTFWLDRYADYYDAKTQWLFEAPILECLYGHAGNMAIRSDLLEKIGDFLPMPIVGDTEILHRALAEIEGVRLRYAPGAEVTHLEVETLRDMLPKLGRYGGYADAVSRKTSYRALTAAERLRAMGRCVVANHYGPIRTLGLLGVLALGALSFESGRLRVARETSRRD